MKNSVRKFAVINCQRNSDKVVLPMNMNALQHILSLNNQKLTEEDSLHISLFTLDYYTNDHDRFSSIRRMAKARRYTDVQTIKLESTYPTNKYLRMIDQDVKISNRFFEHITQRTNLKWIQQGDDRFILVDDSLIPQGLTESFIQRNKLVKKDSILEVYGDTSILSYHYSQWHPEVEKQFKRFMDSTEGAVNFGFEAEKIDADYCEEGIAMKLAHETGFKKEYDGSLGSDGFELISPILPLFNQQVIDESINPVKYLLDAQSNDRCGGHFNISKNGTPSRDILKSIKGSLPILYMMYEKRIDNRYCQAKKFSTYLRSPQKYSACYLKNSSILEIRLFPAIKNQSVLQNRINLTRMMMSELYGKSAIKVLVELANPTSNLHSFVLNVFLNGNRMKLIEKLRKFARYSEQYGCGKISLPTKKKVNKLMQYDVFEMPVAVPPTRPTPEWIPESPVDENETEMDVVSQALNDVRESSVQDSADESFVAPMSDAIFHANPPQELSVERNDYVATEFSRHSLRYHASSDFLFNSNQDMYQEMLTTERFVAANTGMNVGELFRQAIVRTTIATYAHTNGYHESNNLTNDSLIRQFRDMYFSAGNKSVSVNIVKFILKTFFIGRYILTHDLITDETSRLVGYVGTPVGDYVTQMYYSIEFDNNGNVTGCFGEIGEGIEFVIESPASVTEYTFRKLNNIRIV